MTEQDPVTEVPAKVKMNHLRNLAIWLCLLPVVLLILFFSGELSLLGIRSGSVQGVQSKLEVSYSHWDQQVFEPMDSIALKSIIREEGFSDGDDFFVIGDFLPTSAFERPQPVNTPTPTPGQLAEVKLPTATHPQASPTSNPTSSKTPTATQTQPTPTSTPSQTPAEQIPLAQTDTTTPTKIAVVSATPTMIPTSQPIVWTATRTSTPTRRPTRRLTRTATVTDTSTVAPVTSTPTATIFAHPTHTSTPTNQPTFTATSTLETPSPPPPTDTPVTPSVTPDSTWTPTIVPTNIDLPTRTPTQLSLPPGINIGPPDGNYNEIGCGSSIIVDLGSQTLIGRLAYYEVENPSDPGHIALDWVLVYVSPASDGPWTLIFYWGDDQSWNNGDIPANYYPPEIDNQAIGMNELYNGTGIRSVVGGTYRYVLIQAPPGCDDPAQVDGIEVLP